MTNPVDPALASSLSAPASEVPAQQRQSEASSNPSQPQPQQQTQRSKESGKPKKEKKEPKPKDTKDATPATDGAEKLTGAELKKRAKAEKAARRAKEKLDREAGGAPAPAGGSAAGGSAAGAGAGHPATPKKGHGQPAGGSGASGDKGRGLPRRPSGQTPGQPSAAEQKKKAEEKNVAVFGHLYGQQRRATVAGAGKEVHPAVLALGLQMRDYVVCGSSARCVATLLAFKRVCLLLFGLELCGC